MEAVEQNDSTNRDKLIVQQQSEIEKAKTKSSPLVSNQLPISYLNAAYRGDDICAAKIKDLTTKYKFMRRTRPDSHSFLRSFAYAYLEYLIGNKEDYEAFLRMAQESKAKLLQFGFRAIALDDFHEMFMEVIKRVDPDGDTCADIVRAKLHKLFNEQGYSNSVVVYLRLLTSDKLQEEADFYQNFIEGNIAMEEFRHQEVEPMPDHIHIIGLCSALGVGVRVEYIDRGEVLTHDFPEAIKPKVFLLCRPGHYDVLYEK